MHFIYSPVRYFLQLNAQINSIKMTELEEVIARRAKKKGFHLFLDALLADIFFN